MNEWLNLLWKWAEPVGAQAFPVTDSVAQTDSKTQFSFVGNSYILDSVIRTEMEVCCL